MVSNCGRSLGFGQGDTVNSSEPARGLTHAEFEGRRAPTPAERFIA